MTKETEKYVVIADNNIGLKQGLVATFDEECFALEFALTHSQYITQEDLDLDSVSNGSRTYWKDAEFKAFAYRMLEISQPNDGRGLTVWPEREWLEFKSKIDSCNLERGF